jgi:hypothetical protein
MKAPDTRKDFSERLRRLLTHGDPQIRKIAEALGENLAAAFQVVDHLSQPDVDDPPKKKGGRPTKWGKPENRDVNKVLSAWLAVEVQVQLVREKTPNIGVEPAMKAFFTKRNRSPLGSGLYLQTYPDIKIENASTARRRHDEGEKMLRNTPDLAKLWQQILAAELAIWRGRPLRGNSPK